MNFAELKDVELLRAGTWNDTKFTDEDIADIAANADKLGYSPPVKIGHTDDVGGRAWGWVHNVRAVGGKLLGDVRDMPDSLAALIRARAYDALSPEIFLNLKRNGTLYKRALKAVAVLGAEIPAIDGLKPLSEALLSEIAYDGIMHLDLDEIGGIHMAAELDELKKAKEQADRDLAALTAKVEASDKAVKTLSESNTTLKATLDAHAASTASLQADLAKQRAANIAMRLAQKIAAVKIPAYRPFFAMLYGHAMGGEQTVKFGEKETSLEAVLDDMVAKMGEAQAWMFKNMSKADDAGADYASPADAGIEASRRAEKLTAEKGITYSQALTQVLAADPALKSAYAGV